MPNRAPESTLVFLWLVEPLLRAGVLASLQSADGLDVADAAAGAGPGDAQVVVTDWPTGLTISQRRGSLETPLLPPHARVLVIAAQTREHQLASALRSGIHGVVRSSCSPGELVQAVQSVARGVPYLCPEMVQRITASAGRGQLTSREGEVLRLLARGQCNKNIARQLGIAVGTVKTHVKGIMGKLNATTRTEAASIATEKGLVEVPGFQTRRTTWLPAPASGRPLDPAWAVDLLAAA